MTTKIIIATTNQGKIKEFKEAFAKFGRGSIDLFAIDELYKGDFDVEENGASFLENSRLKALAGAKLTEEYCLADDSGIEIKALGGRPGIYSGRYLKQAGGGIHGVLQELAKLAAPALATETRCRQAEGGTQSIQPAFSEKADWLGAKKETFDRSCRFVCALTLANPYGEIVFETEQYWYGTIATEPRGDKGFGYDPIVIPSTNPADYPQDLFTKSQIKLTELLSQIQAHTVGELEAKLKNTLSHRGQAILYLLNAIPALYTNFSGSKA
jgi:XTP/dITP diphosphohydrolase